MEEAQLELSVLVKGRYQIKRNASLLQDTWIESLASARALEGDVSMESELWNMRQIERQRKDARLIKCLTGKQRTFGLTLVIAPTATGQWEEQSTKEDIE